jgi:hypothetical protein
MDTITSIYANSVARYWLQCSSIADTLGWAGDRYRHPGPLPQRMKHDAAIANT